MASKITRTIKRNVVIVTLIAILAVTLLATGYQNSNMSIVNPGWEIYNSVAGVTFGGGVKTGPNDFPNPVVIGQASWVVDDDDPAWGLPDIMIQTSEMRHVDFTGTVTPATQPATAPIEKNINNKLYIVDQHIYMFDVTVRTIADREHKNNAGVNIFQHETSWSKTTDGWLYNDHSWDGHTGRPFNGGVYVKFIINPWTGIPARETPQGYQLTGAWAGVMGAKVFTKEQGQVANKWGELPNPSAEAPIFVRGGLDNGAQINMYEDAGGFGTPAPVIPWDPNQVLDPRIKSSVVLYLPAELQAGAYLTKNWAGVTTQLTPCDVYIKYTVRVDVLQAHEYVLVTNPVPQTLEPPVDYFSWAKGFWDSLFSTNSILFWLIIAVLIIVVLYIVLKFVKGNGSGETTGDENGRYVGIKWYHWAVIGVLLLFSIIPDPTDLIDFGMPVIEPLMAAVYYIIVRKKGGEN